MIDAILINGQVILVVITCNGSIKDKIPDDCRKDLIPTLFYDEIREFHIRWSNPYKVSLKNTKNVGLIASL